MTRDSVSPDPPPSWSACIECGNDDPAEGSTYCLDCLESLAARAEAWEDGYDAGHADARAVQPTYPNPTPNPYRDSA